MLIQYIRRGKRLKLNKEGIVFLGKKREKIKGVMIAFAEGDKLYIGWSMCHKKDKFSMHKAFNIATERAEKWYSSKIQKRHPSAPYYYLEYNTIPASIAEEFQNFVERAINYYKDKVIPIWVINFRMWRKGE
jgi:hypothetical protein